MHPTSSLRNSQRWWRDVALLAIGAIAVRVPSMLAPTQLGYDDGGYGLAAIAMRQGYQPFRQIFSPQGPLFHMVPFGAAFIVVALSAPWGFTLVLDDYVRYHLDKTADRKPLHNLNRLVRAFAERDTFLSALAVVAASSALGRWFTRRWFTRRSSSASHDHHATADAAPRRWMRAFEGDAFLWWWTGITIVTLPIQATILRALLVPHEYGPTTARIDDDMRALPRTAWALSDEPGLACAQWP